MTDREKVAKGIDICLDRFHCSADCPYYANNLKTGCMEQLQNDAIAMFKEQEPLLVLNISPIFYGRSGNCPSCGRGLDSTIHKHYCSECGQAVKWDE